LSHEHRRPALFLGLLLAGASVAPAAPGDPPPPELRAMAEARYRAALNQFEESWTYYRQARSDPFLVYAWSRLVLESQRELSDEKANHVAALEEHRERMERLENLVKKVRRLGFGRSIDVGAVNYYRLEAEYWMARAKSF